jgi:autotransporter-associated beta strand protein
MTLNNGTFIADTTNGAIALNNGSSSYSQKIIVGSGGGTIDVIGGNTLTISGAISGINTAAPLTFGSATTSGTTILTGANTYTGGSILAGGVVQLGVAETLGTSGPLGTWYPSYNAGAQVNTITFRGGTLQYSAANSYDYSSRFSQLANQSFNIDTNGQSVAFATGLQGANSTLTKYGTGTLTLSGASGYTGATSVVGGTLAIASTGSLVTPSINIGAGAAFTLQSGGSVAGVMALTNNGNVTFNAAQNLASLNGTSATASVNLNSSTLTVTGGGVYAGLIADGASAGSLTVGGGTLELTGSNTYTGATAVNAGTLQIGDGSKGSIASASVTVASGANVVFNQVDQAIYAGAIVNNGGTVKATGSNQNTLSGSISGVGGFSQEGSGITVLAGNDTYSGDTNVTSGQLKVTGTSSNSTFRVSNNATLGGSGVINGAVNVTSGTVNGTNLAVTGTTTFGGASTLAGSMTSSGGISVAASGALNVTGHTTSNVTVNSAALNGSGSVGNVILSSGTLSGTLSTGGISGTGLVSPGNSPGILTATSVTSTAASGLLNFAFELSATTPDYANAAASLNDVLHITTTDGLTLDAGTNISIYFASLSSASKFDGGFFVDGMTSSALKSAVSNATFTFYVEDANGTTTFNGNTYSAEESQISVSAIALDTAPFSTGTTSGAQLEFTVVPEPSTWAMLVGGIGMLGFAQRLRRRSDK